MCLAWMHHKGSGHVLCWQYLPTPQPRDISSPGHMLLLSHPPPPAHTVRPATGPKNATNLTHLLLVQQPMCLSVPGSVRPSPQAAPTPTMKRNSTPLPLTKRPYITHPALTGAAGLSSAVSGRLTATRWKPLSSWLLVTSLLSVSLNSADAAAAAASKGWSAI